MAWRHGGAFCRVTALWTAGAEDVVEEADIVVRSGNTVPGDQGP